jgi:YVTN family beta-propeller protein
MHDAAPTFRKVLFKRSLPIRRTRMLAVISLLLSGILLTLTVSAQNTGYYVLPDRNTRLVTSGTMQSARNGSLLVTANKLNNTVSLVAPFRGQREAEIAVGREPRNVAITPDNSRALVTSRRDGTLNIIDLDQAVLAASYAVGTLPYGVVALNDSLAAVALQGTNEIVFMDLNTGRITMRIPTPEAPAGLALWGDRYLYVTHLWSGEFSLIFLPQARLIQTISTGLDTGLSQSITIDPQRGVAYLPQTRYNPHNRMMTYDSIAFPVVNVVDLSTMTLLPRSRIALNIADQPVNMPFASAIDVSRRWLYIANAGSNNISVIDLTTGLAVETIPTDANPRAVLLTRDAGTLYIHNMLDGTITFIGVSDFRVIDEVPISDLVVPADIIVGAELFHSASDPRLSADGWLSCATCHFEGDTSGRIWLGYAGGTRTAPLLYRLGDRGLYNRTASWDELADVEIKIRRMMAGSGFIDAPLNDPLGDPHSGLSPDLDSLVAYLLTLDGPPAPQTATPEILDRGAEVFTALNCASCHINVTGSDGQRHDVGTSGEYLTPQIGWLWQSAPYLHDGRAASLRDLFILPGTHQIITETTPEEMDALIAYLLSLPTE